MNRIVIIGGGWYGCHIASLLKDKYTVTIIEKKDTLFNNSSYYNQNRLHLGFHYPRNYDTRHLCQKNYDRFTKKYEELIVYIDNNYYVISKDSWIDYNTFVSIYTHEKFSFELIENELFSNIDGNIIKVSEHVIHSDKAKNYFLEELKQVDKKFNTRVTHYTKEKDIISVHTNHGIIECDLLLDCTYNQLELSKKGYIYEDTISLLFHKKQESDFTALTIMDGQFSSLYPRDIEKNIYTLTDVKYTPLQISSNYTDEYPVFCIEDIKYKMIQNLEIYYPTFEKDFEYAGYFLSKKTKLNSKCDSRNISITEIEKNVISVNCGKIYGIFDFEDYMMKYLGLE